MKVGDLVKWRSKTNPNYYGEYREAVGVIVKVHHYPDKSIIADILMDGNVTRWNETNLEVLSESR